MVITNIENIYAHVNIRSVIFPKNFKNHGGHLLVFNWFAFFDY